MTMSGSNMLWHNQKIGFNPNTIALTSGAFFVSLGITIRI